jgi:hypothetical protein
LLCLSIVFQIVIVRHTAVTIIKSVLELVFTYFLVPFKKFVGPPILAKERYCEAGFLTIKNRF